MIARDANSSGTTAGTALTISHTCSGSNRALLVFVSVANSSDLVTSVTYNSVTLTQLKKSQEGAGGRWIYAYGLIAPSTGANNIVVNLSSSATVEAGGASYTGVQQSGLPDASGAKTTNTVTTQTLAVTTVNDNCWMVSGCQCRFNANPVASTGVSQVTQYGGGSTIGDSNGVIHPAGSYSMTWNSSNGTNDEFNVVQISLTPATLSPQFYPITNGHGYVQSHNLSTWAAARTDNPALNVVQNTFGIYTTFSGGPTYNNIRSFLPFDISSIPLNAIINSATLQIYRDDSISTFGNADSTTASVIQTTESSTSNLQLSDYNNVSFVSGGSSNLSASSNNSYFTITLNATGLTWLPLGGIAKLGLLTGLDLGNVAPTGTNNLSFQSGTGTNKPILTINYSLPSVGFFFGLI